MNVTLDTELEINATVAALMERGLRLSQAIIRLGGQAPSRDRDFALDCNRDALRDTNRALLTISGKLPDEVEPPDGAFADRLNPYPEPPEGWQENELAGAWGR